MKATFFIVYETCNTILLLPKKFCGPPLLGAPRSSGALVHWTAWTPGFYGTDCVPQLYQSICTSDLEPIFVLGLGCGFLFWPVSDVLSHVQVFVCILLVAVGLVVCTNTTGALENSSLRSAKSLTSHLIYIASFWGQVFPAIYWLLYWQSKPRTPKINTRNPNN